MKIAAENLSVILDGQTVLDNITYTFGDRGVTAVLGLNGAGKTTLLKALTGLQKPSGGRILYNDKPIESIGLRERAKRLSYIPQLMDKPLRYTVKDFILMGANPYLNVFGLPGKRFEKRADEAMKLFHIESLCGKCIDSLSGGELKTVYLARAFFQDAEFMVLDEPNASLDTIRQYEFMESLTHFVQQKKAFALLSLHDPNIALRYADQVLFLHHKKIAAVLDRSCADFYRAFADALNSIYRGKFELLQNQNSYYFNWRED